VTLDAAPAAPPVTDGAHVIVALANGTITARQLTDGSEAWSRPLAATLPLVVDGDRLFVATRGALHALATADGVTRWERPTPTLAAPPVARGGWVIVTSETGRVLALAAADGGEVWRRDLSELSAAPAIDGALLVLPLADGRLVALDIQTGTPVWERQLGSAPTSPLIYGDRLYVGTAAKQFTCLRRATGQVDWSWQIGARIVGTPAADAERVYVSAMDNVIRALDRSSGAQRWKAALKYRPTTGPVLLGTHVTVAGGTQELPGFDARTGKPSGTLALEALLAAPPGFFQGAEDSADPAIATISGGMTGQWTLRLSVPPPPAAPTAPANPSAPTPPADPSAPAAPAAPSAPPNTAAPTPAAVPPR
jgi:outer membrane protein assembly factor BamB